MTIDLRPTRLHTTRRMFLGMSAAGLLLPAGYAKPALAQAEPKKGGRLRIGCTGGSTGDTLDPALILDTYMAQVSFGQLRNCLTEIAADGSLIPELAEEWNASADAATWTFTLRQGVEFHNGKTMTVDDVIASLNHHRGEASTSAAKDILAGVTDIRADGAGKIVVTLASGNADFPYLLSDYHLGVCPATADGTIDWQSGVGTGGYVLQSFEPGVSTLTSRNPNYWKAGRAHFDEVQTLFIADVTARTNALQSGAIDVMNKVDLKSVRFLKEMPGIVVFSTESNQHVALPMRADTAPFDNNDVRLALKYSVGRQNWLDTIFQGYGAIGNDHPIGAANRYQATTDEIPQREYDLDKAKFHLKAAGLDTLDVTLHVAETAFAGATDAAQLYQQQAMDAGINITIERVPEDGYWSEVWLKAPWCASFWGGRPTEDWMFTQVYAAGASWNESHWDHARFNELLVAARSELDEAKRREMYVEMQRIVHDEGSTVVPLYASYVQAASDKLQLPEQIGNNWELDGNKCAERWSFA